MPRTKVAASKPSKRKTERTRRRPQVNNKDDERITDEMRER